MATESKCPVDHGSVGVGQQNDDWWPNQLNLRVLPHGIAGASPMGDDIDYATEFESLDLAAVKGDLVALMTDSQEWWPATTATTVRSSFAWPGTVPAPTAPAMGAEAEARACSASLH